MTRESEIEKYLHHHITALGGTTRKWSSPGRAGVPDRICFLPGGIIFFVEVKTETGKTTVRQVREIESLRELGAVCHVAHGKEGVDKVVDEYRRGW